MIIQSDSIEILEHERTLGSGSYSTVYRARMRIGTGWKEVALKKFFPLGDHDEETLQESRSFAMKEAFMLATIGKPGNLGSEQGVVQTYGFAEGVNDRGPWFGVALRYYKDGTLARLLKRAKHEVGKSEPSSPDAFELLCLLTLEQHFDRMPPT